MKIINNENFQTYICSTLDSTCSSSPLSEMSLTLENVRKVMEGARKWWDIGSCLLIPKGVLHKIAAKYSSDNEKICALASYMVTTLPNITWEDIAGALYKEDENRAVERVKPYISVFDGKGRCTCICVCIFIAG